MERFIKKKEAPRGRPFPQRHKLAPGRPKGVKNKIPTMIKEAIEIALNDVGEPQPVYAPLMKQGKQVKVNGVPQFTKTIIGWKATGLHGAVGYLKWLALQQPTAFTGLLAKTLPLQIKASAEVQHTVTATSKYSEADTSRMTLAELTAAFQDLVQASRPLPARPQLAYDRGRVIDVTPNQENAALCDLAE